MSNYDLQKAHEYFRDKIAFTTGVHELDGIIQRNKGDFTVVDVRYPADYARGHVPGAVNLPKGKWQNPKGLSKTGINYLYCYSQTCHLAAEAAMELTRQGYQVMEVEGGWAEWEAKGYRIEQLAASA
ncbi:MAG TPA: rhodanese-like domain-containing protein [Gammaproteobacteria bacterium]|nr:rhodanese-like domain-containing protein [Gammaproteobacteria bacterium]